MGFNSVPAGKDIPNEIYVAIEIPANSSPIKYEIDKDSDCVFVDRFMATPMFYPANYGYVPNSLGEDGDPLDVLVVTPYPVVPGSVIRARPVGVLNMSDEAGSDAKILAVPHDKLTALYQDVKEYSDLPELLIKQIEHFFENYKDLEPGKAEDFEAVTGQGVTGRVEGRDVALGNVRLMKGLSLDPAPLLADADRHRDEGETVMFVAIGGRIAGLVCVADPVKQTTPDALKQLHAQGFRIIMATGDNERTAKAVAARLGIDEIRADVLPEDKARIIRELQAGGARVAMAGDGVNDAPALAQADVGIAMGTGADVAIESAGFTLVKGDLTGIVRARRLSTATMRNIRQNLFFALVYNASGVPIAAGVLYPVMGMLISPMFAAAAMSLSSVSVITNALRLRSVKL